MSAGLNREAKLARLAAIEEKRKRIMRSKPQYVATPGQLKVLACKARNRFNFSGNGGGKTTMLVHEMVAIAKGTDPWKKHTTRVPAKVIVVVDNARKIDERIIPELKKWYEIDDSWLKRLGKPYTSRIEWDNGSVIDFYSADADPSSFEGIEASAVLVDEPIPRTLYIALKRSLRVKGHLNTFLFCGTAISEAWLRREIYEPWVKGELPDTECFRMSSDDNAVNLADGYLEEFGRSLSEAEKEVRLRGGFFDTEALALAHLWNRAYHVVPTEQWRYEDSPCVIAVDPHSVKPHTAILLTCDKQDNFIAIKEMSFRGNATQFAERLVAFKSGYKVIDIVCDSLGAMEGTSFEGMHSFIEGVRKTGIQIRSTLFKEKNAEDLVSRLQNALTLPDKENQFGQRIPRLRVLSQCRSLIADIEAAAWQKNRMTGELLPKIDTSIRDTLSCLGYALAANLFYDKIVRSQPIYKETIGERVTGDNEAREARRASIIRARRGRMISRGIR